MQDMAAAMVKQFSARSQRQIGLITLRRTLGRPVHVPELRAPSSTTTVVSWHRSSRRKRRSPKNARWSPASTTTAWRKTLHSTPTPASFMPNSWQGPTPARCTTMTCDSIRPTTPTRHAGLPPGPIGNPGKSALEAAMHPAQSDYYLLCRRRRRPPPLRPHHSKSTTRTWPPTAARCEDSSSAIPESGTSGSRRL